MTGDLADTLKASPISGQEIIAELERRGINASSLCELSMDQLGELFRAVIMRLSYVSGQQGPSEICSG